MHDHHRPILGVAAVVVVFLAVLTGVGSHRRGDNWCRAVADALVFPATWVVWYVKDILLAQRRTL